MLERLQDAARLAERLTPAVRILVTTDGFKVEAKRGKAWASRFVSIGEVELANCNVLAATVQAVSKDARANPEKG